MSKLRNALIGLMALAACQTQLPETDTYQPPETVMPPTGSIGSASFVSLFLKTCYAHFPDSKSLAVEFRKSGFAPTAKPSESQQYADLHFYKRNEHLSSVFGEYEFRLEALDSVHYSDVQSCHVEADLSDPEQIDRALEQLVTPDGNAIVLVADEGRSSYRSARTMHQSGEVRIEFEQGYCTHETMNDALPKACGGLEECLTWLPAMLTITTLGVPKSE